MLWSQKSASIQPQTGLPKFAYILIFSTLKIHPGLPHLAAVASDSAQLALHWAASASQNVAFKLLRCVAAPLEQDCNLEPCVVRETQRSALLRCMAKSGKVQTPRGGWLPPPALGDPTPHPRWAPRAWFCEERRSCDAPRRCWRAPICRG